MKNKILKKKYFNILLFGFIILIITIITIITMGIFFKNKNTGSMDSNYYQKISLNDIESKKDKFDNKKVEYTGVFESMFETSLLDGKIWLQTSSSTVYIPDIKEFPGLNNKYYHAKVKVYGTLQTKKSSYGHLGASQYQIVADKIELLEKLSP